VSKVSEHAEFFVGVLIGLAIASLLAWVLG